MPPFLPSYRRLTSESPPPSKPTLFDTIDRPGASTTLHDNRAFLNKLNGSQTDSSLSDISSDHFEDVLSQPSPKRVKLDMANGDDEGGVDWEDAMGSAADPNREQSSHAIKDLQITLGKPSHLATRNVSRSQKHGPSKIERQIRMSIHRMHVQLLMFHNMVRSGWATDKDVHKILLSQLSENERQAIEHWRVDSGLQSRQERKLPIPRRRTVRQRHPCNVADRNQRNWGSPAERQEHGAPNMSHGDPILRLLKVLAIFWKKKFAITAPGLRKQGYKAPAVLEHEIATFRSGRQNHEHHGERIENIEAFRKAAECCEGSRDVGAQLFTALLRALGIETRLVASLQPLGFGWTKSEEATIKRRGDFVELNDPEVLQDSHYFEDAYSDDPSDHVLEKSQVQCTDREPMRNTTKQQRPRERGSASLKSLRGSDQTDGPTLRGGDDSDDASIIDVTPSSIRRRPNMNYDRDMPAPIYWSEVISPITQKVHVVDPLILTPAVVTSSEQLTNFEPRGARAEKAKQILAYVVAYAADGTAKDVTTRYLKRHVWPGKTRGWRLPIEKLPIRNRQGKITRYEDRDWFKGVMRGYQKAVSNVSTADRLEDDTDLKAANLEKKEGNAGPDTLQFYKTSAEFVLERHLRREEALKPDAKPVKSFTCNSKTNLAEEYVYHRRDVEVCRTGESWHKEGRAIKPGQKPMKLVPVRAVTLTRKREVEEAERGSGEKLKQGLYSWNQTDWIIPPPITNGIIPKNTYNNIDCFVPTMVPKGAVHIPLRSTVKVCKRLGIDYAEAVTGFEFGNKMAVPVITGVVVAERNGPQVLAEWHKDEAERKIKEEGKREKMALGIWRKWLMGLRIIERVRQEYGTGADAQIKEDMNPFTNQGKAVRLLDNTSSPKGQITTAGKTPTKIDLARGRQINNVENGEGGFLRDEVLEDDSSGQCEGKLVIEDEKEVQSLQPQDLVAEDDLPRHRSLEAQCAPPISQIEPGTTRRKRSRKATGCKPEVTRPRDSADRSRPTPDDSDRTQLSARLSGHLSGQSLKHRASSETRSAILNDVQHIEKDKSRGGCRADDSPPPRPRPGGAVQSVKRRGRPRLPATKDSYTGRQSRKRCTSPCVPNSF